MGLLITLLIIFMIVLALTLLLPPDRMSDKEVFKAKVSQIWCAVNICRTTGLGEPLLQIRSPKGFDLLKIDFPDKDTVIVSLPLIQIEQRDMKATYLEIFVERGFDVTESIYAENYPVLNISLDRKTENLGQLITSLYQKLFHARIGDNVSLTVWTLKPDMGPLRNMFTHKMKPNEDAKFVAASARFSGRHAHRIQIERILFVANFLLYPLVITLSYNAYGLNGLCWGAFTFFTFFFAYRVFYQKKPVIGSQTWSYHIAAPFLIATLATQKTVYIQSIPSILAAISTVLAIATIFGMRNPFSTEKPLRKKNNQQTFVQGFLVFGNGFIIFANEWVRSTKSFDDWVWFYGFFRIEFIIAMSVFAIPAAFIFVKMQQKSEEEES